MAHAICLECCDYARKECEGKEEFPGLLIFALPDCFRACTDHCLFDGDCPAAIDELSEEVDVYAAR